MDNEDISGGENDWVEVEPSSYTIKAQWYNGEKSVAIKDCFFKDSAIFPPGNHEDLPIVYPHKGQVIEGQQLFHSASSSASLSSDGDHSGEGEEAESENKAGSWIRMRLGFLSSGIDKIVSLMKNHPKFRASIWLFVSATTRVGALMLVVVLYRRAKRWKRQLQSESKHHLMLLIKEKDQKIDQLLLQLAQLNDLSSARRRVPVLQVA